MYVPVTAIVGLSGCVITAVGVTELDAADAALLPTLFVATTVKVYEVSFVSPVIVIGLPFPLAVMLSGFDVTV